MVAAFKTYIKEQANVTDGDIELMIGKAVQRNARRKELLLQEGDICRYKVFVASGMLRTYRIKQDGSEYIVQFSPENTWAIDPESYDNVIPSSYHIEALEDSEVLLWAKSDFEYLLAHIPALKTFSAKIISQNIYLTRQRVFSAISSSAEEKYDEFIKTSPHVFARVPLHMVASYLGVSRETLSRIRHAQVKR